MARLTTTQCAHIWAQRTQEHGKASTLEFNNDVIEAGRVVGVLVTDKEGKTCALIRWHSVRCGYAHVNYGSTVSSAASQYERHSVTDLESFRHQTGRRHDCRDASTRLLLIGVVNGELATWRARFPELLKPSRRQYDSAESRAERVAYALKEIATLVDAFDLASAFDMAALEAERDQTIAGIRAAFAAQEAHDNDLARVARRDKARASREKRQARFDDEFTAWQERGTPRPQYSAYNESFSQLDRRAVKRTLEDDEYAFKNQSRYVRRDGEYIDNPDYVPREAWDFMRPVRRHAAKIKKAQETLETFRRDGFTWRYDSEKVAEAFSLLYSTLSESDRVDLFQSISAALYAQRIDESFAVQNPDARDIVWRRQREKYCHQSEARTVDDWRNGVGTANFYDCDQTLVRRKGNRLETSRGAEAPFASAVVIFLKAQQYFETGKTWAPNGERFKAGLFELSSIDETGGINIGCHRIEYQEMLNLATREIPKQVTKHLPALI